MQDAECCRDEPNFPRQQFYIKTTINIISFKILSKSLNHYDVISVFNFSANQLDLCADDMASISSHFQRGVLPRGGSNAGDISSNWNSRWIAGLCCRLLWKSKLQCDIFHEALQACLLQYRVQQNIPRRVQSHEKKQYVWEVSKHVLADTSNSRYLISDRFSIMLYDVEHIFIFIWVQNTKNYLIHWKKFKMIEVILKYCLSLYYSYRPQVAMHFHFKVIINPFATSISL